MDSRCFPSPQSTHVPCPGEELYFPLSQSEHEDDPEAEYSPAEHIVHAPPSSEENPGSQSPQMPSPGVELLPAGHDVHHATPASEYVPEAQLKQSYHPPSELYLPASQVTHEELSKLELRGTLEPGSQKWHVPVSGGGGVEGWEG